MGAPAEINTFKVVTIVLMVLCLPVIVGRGWVRIKHSIFGFDDIFITLAYILFVVFGIMSAHSVNLGLGDPDVAPLDQLEAMKIFVIAQLLCLIAMYLAKVSVAMVLLRIAAPMSAIRNILIASIALLTAWFLVCIIMWGLTCIPFAATWGEPGTCKGAGWTAATANMISTMDIVFTFFYGILPVFMLWNVQISLRTKLGVYALLGLNVVTCAVTIVRLKYIIELESLGADQAGQIIIVEAEASVYSSLDVGLTLILTSLAALKPLLGYIPFLRRVGGSTPRSGGHTGGAGSDLRTFGQGGRGTDFEMHAGNAIRLDDKSEQEDTGSTDDILPPSGASGGRGGSGGGTSSDIQKHVRYEVTFKNADAP